MACQSKWEGREGTYKPCPQNIIYNKYIGEEDCGDQLHGYYNCKIKSHKLYKYIVFFLFNVTIMNTYILHITITTTNI